MTQDLRRSLREFQDYADDVQRSGFQTFDDALKRLLSVLDATTPMGCLTIRVLPQPDFEAWYQAALAQTGGMGGIGPLSWPPANADRIALQLELLRRRGELGRAAVPPRLNSPVNRLSPVSRPFHPQAGFVFAASAWSG